MTLLTRVSLYGIFAACAVVANLLTQRIVLLAGNSAAIFVAALFAGTITGLAVKYVLDKHWIFANKHSGLATNMSFFYRYAMTGLLTTLLFWATESVFWLVWSTTEMRELGAIVGLTSGYVVKYHLDKKFVFSACDGA